MLDLGKAVCTLEVQTKISAIPISQVWQALSGASYSLTHQAFNLVEEKLAPDGFWREFGYDKFGRKVKATKLAKKLVEEFLLDLGYPDKVEEVQKDLLDRLSRVTFLRSQNFCLHVLRAKDYDWLSCDENGTGDANSCFRLGGCFQQHGVSLKHSDNFVVVFTRDNEIVGRCLLLIEGHWLTFGNFYSRGVPKSALENIVKGLFGPCWSSWQWVDGKTFTNIYQNGDWVSFSLAPFTVAPSHVVQMYDPLNDDEWVAAHDNRRRRFSFDPDPDPDEYQDDDDEYQDDDEYRDDDDEYQDDDDTHHHHVHIQIRTATRSNSRYCANIALRGDPYIDHGRWSWIGASPMWDESWIAWLAAMHPNEDGLWQGHIWRELYRQIRAAGGFYFCHPDDFDWVVFFVEGRERYDLEGDYAPPIPLEEIEEAVDSIVQLND